MSDLELEIPDRQTTAQRRGDFRHTQIEERIEALPAFDIPGRLQALGLLIDDINCVRLPTGIRAALLLRIDREVDDILPAWQKATRHHSFPLPAKAQTHYQTLQTMLASAATAYKLLTLDLLKEKRAADDRALLAAFLGCVKYLSQRAVQAHATYQPAPPDLWKDLHRLYRYAETHRIGGDYAELHADESIRAAYARIVLLTLANPHHLMQGEVYLAYEYLKKWAVAVRFSYPDELSLPGQTEMAGHYICDLSGSSPPCYSSPDTAPIEGTPLVIRLDEVLTIVTNRMKVIALQVRRSLQLRSEWDLLVRLRNAWSERALRSQERTKQHGTVKVIIGLSSCHYFYSGCEKFKPEQIEVALHGDNFGAAHSLSLVPAEDTPWVDNDLKSKLQSGVINPRAYLFDAEHRDNDIWKKSVSVGPRRDTQLEQGVESRTLDKIHEFIHTDDSVGGKGLKSVKGSVTQLRVGELVAAFPEETGQDDEPALHVVRWLHCETDAKLAAGLRRIPGNPQAVAVRALDQETHYRGYAMAFLVDTEENGLSLIVPAGLFSFGSTLLLNDGERIQCLRLDSILENTRAFTQFRFSRFQADDTLNSEIIASLKQLLKDAVASN